MIDNWIREFTARAARGLGCGVLATIVVTVAGGTQAATFDDIDFWVGSGANEAALVIDWNDGKSPESLLWGYRWDGSATGEDMLTAVVAADSRLYATLGVDTGFGTPVYGLGYNLDNGGFGTSPTLTFIDGIATISDSADTDDARMPSDADDHYSEGWNSGFWGYYVGGQGATASWQSSLTGMSGRVLVDGTWDGWSFAPSFDFTTPTDPVPEPLSFALASCGLLLCLSRRRRMT